MLTIRNLSKTYHGGVRALDRVSLDIPKGMFGLLGPNGAGKSTLMRTLATLQEPDEGSISLGPVNFLRQKSAVRRILGYLPQEFGVYPRISARAMLNHFAVLKGIVRRGERADIVEHLLVQANLYDVADRRLDTFSGGMKQRFGIAQALLADPQLVIVDEPTAGLDPEERNRFHNLLSEIGQDVVVILSTHIVEDVRELCQTMAIIAAGRILLVGTPDEAMKSLAGTIWKTSIDKSELPDYQRRHSVLSTRLFGGRTVIRVCADDQPAGFEPVEPTLEDLYFSTLQQVA